MLRKDKHLQRVEYPTLALDSFTFHYFWEFDCYNFWQLFGTPILTSSRCQGATSLTQSKPINAFLIIRFSAPEITRKHVKRDRFEIRFWIQVHIDSLFCLLLVNVSSLRSYCYLFPRHLPLFLPS